MNGTTRPAVLCVDDDPRVLDGLRLHLRRDCDLHTATGGSEALDILERLGGVAVVVTDMRMPGMDGGALLAQVRVRWPDAVRMLLTGDPGRDAAVAAVNDGQIFRYLVKPCPPDRLRQAVADGIRAHQSSTAEKRVLEETLLGSVAALVDVLGLTNPVAFGRAARVKRTAARFAASMPGGCPWELEVAAMLSQIGYLALPAAVVEKHYYGARLSDAERALVDDVPKVAEGLLGHIPRLEEVLAILKLTGRPAERIVAAEPTGRRAAILRLVLDFDEAVSQGHEPALALGLMRSRAARYDRELLELFAAHIGGSPRAGDVREMPLEDVRVGMVLLKELRTEAGSVLVPAGFEITPSFLERMRHFSPRLLAGRVEVRVGDDGTARQARC